ncbi:hypothetical protein FE783_28835 [Paenibacillus mesophilus]|uniref:cadherin domain-containing protein n=1 Tax=Paenibacillus mesophilus TaxID=2582849 RepID=UPI00110E2DA2|nr:cadherin domain-containing protein [Paenibacillus mesophilus]TMV45510.1 hypothetical protein FE783_28835 [Paenibacillus mesophilus]
MKRRNRYDLKKAIGMLLLAVVVAASGLAVVPSGGVQAIPAPAPKLQTLVFSDQNSRDLPFRGVTLVSSPNETTFNIRFFEDTQTARITALPVNPGDTVKVTLDNTDTVTQQGGVTNYDIPVTLDSSQLKIKVIDASNSSNFGEYTVNLHVSMWGNGTVDDPFRIWTVKQFLLLKDYPWPHNNNSAYKLMADLDLSSYIGSKTPINRGWQPINFYGNFDGNGKTISGLWTDRSPSDSNVGLFGQIGGSADIQNMKLMIGLYGVNGYNTVGGLVGRMDSGAKVSNVSVIGNVTNSSITEGSYTGGVVGSNNSGTIDKALFNGIVVGGGNVGGIVGYHTGAGPMTRSAAIGNVLANGDNAGGLIGRMQTGTVSESFSGGTVQGVNQIGGLIGLIENGTITDAYSSTSAFGFNYVGGLAGKMASATISNVYATGFVQSLGSPKGGLVGGSNSEPDAPAGSITSSYWNKDTTGQTTSRGAGDAKTTTEMQQQSTFEQWDFTNVWMIRPNQSPVLKWLFPNQAPTGLNLSAVSITENKSSGTVIGTFSTTDPDASDTFAYSLVPGTGSDDNGSFSISGGALVTNAVFDYETKKEYKIRVQTMDSGNLTFEKALTITVADVKEAPTDVTLSGATVVENAPIGTPVGTLGNVDPDAGETYIYQLVSGTGDTDNGSFTIVGNMLQTSEAFNYEAKNSYSIRVSVSDAVYTYAKPFTITVTDVKEAPTDITLSGAIVAENAPIGTPVGTLGSVDQDAGETYTYQFASGTGDTDNGSFAIVGNMLQTTASFDYETKQSYSIRVSVNDAVYSYSKSFAILVQDVAESPTELMLSHASTAENAPIGTPVGTFASSAPNAGSVNLVALTAGAGDADNANFTIDGTILRTNASFDYESRTSYNIRVQVLDSVYGAVYSYAKPFVISITDVKEAPTALALDGATIAENAPIGTRIGAFSATDPDQGETYTYQLVSGEGSEDNAGFTIDGNVLRAAASFDYETKSSYRIRASVSDSVYSYAKPFVISITDVKEAPTALALDGATIAENASVGTRIGAFSVTDPDQGETYTYQLVSGEGSEDNTSFTIDGNVLRAAASFDYVMKSSYRIRASVSDSVNSYAKPFVISITDVKEAPTALTLDGTTITENAPIGTRIGTFSATDPDQGETYTYQMVSGEGSEDNASFTIDGNVLKAAVTFDYETKNKYTIRVWVSDGTLFYEKPFTVTVTDVVETPGGSGGGGGGPTEEPGNPPETPTPSTPAPSNPGVEVIVNGDRQNQLAQAKVEESGGQRTIVVTLDPDKIAFRIGQEGTGAVITIPVTVQADKVAGELNGAIVKLMEGKQAVLVIDTGSASYTLPAAQINIDDVSKLFGEQLSLADIRVRVEISAASAEQSGLLNRTAGEQAFTPIVTPVNFTVTATYDGETVEIKTFTAYVEREIKLPDGIDPSKITTGIVINPDGTVTHVPTYIVERDGKWYARINSLTNSPYSVIWNPQSFADTARHWAESIINDMASRKVVNGVDGRRFEPDLSITRAEFAAIAVRALGLGDNGGSRRFSDVLEGDWYYGAVSKAWEYGLIEGFEDGTFQPGQMITREQAMVMLRKAMKLAGLQTAVQDAERVLASYPDSNQIATWAKDSVAAAVSAGLVQGRESGIAPKQTITRAETAKLVYELLISAKLINK